MGILELLLYGAGIAAGGWVVVSIVQGLNHVIATQFEGVGVTYIMVFPRQDLQDPDLAGREVTLKIFVEPENSAKCDHALASLKQAMTWDEQRVNEQLEKIIEGRAA